jgi:hypothetical protein
MVRVWLHSGSVRFRSLTKNLKTEGTLREIAEKEESDPPPRPREHHGLMGGDVSIGPWEMAVACCTVVGLPGLPGLPWCLSAAMLCVCCPPAP